LLTPPLFSLPAAATDTVIVIIIIVAIIIVVVVVIVFVVVLIIIVVVVVVIAIAIAVAAIVFVAAAAAVVAAISAAVAVAIATTNTTCLCCFCCWLIVALLSTVRFCHRTQSCNHQRSHCRPLLPPVVVHCRHCHCCHCLRTVTASIATTVVKLTFVHCQRKAKAAAPPAYQWQHQRENDYKSRQLGLI
jgi:hypothetical protein